MALTSAPLSSGIGVNVKGIDLTRSLALARDMAVLGKGEIFAGNDTLR